MKKFVHIIKNFVKRFPSLLFVLRLIFSFMRQVNSNSKWKSLINKDDIKLELGSGPKKGLNGWTTVDLNGADIIWDLRKSFPLPSDCITKIYSSHLLEHISYQQLIPFLKECLRVLKPNGEFSVCVPNARLVIDGYIAGKLTKERETWWQPGVVDTGSKIDELNYLAYLGGQHKYMFDKENLLNTLFVSGFKSANLRKFDEELDMLERDYQSIYAVAKK